MLRIGTWNVEYADSVATNRRRRAVLDDNPADIWVLTETHDPLKPKGVFTSAHSRQRPHYGRRVRRGSRWVSIWARSPISLERRPRVSDPERTLAVVAKTPHGRIIIFGTVFPWRGDVERKIDHAVRLQLADVARLRRRFPRTPICVAGDINTDLASMSYFLTMKAHDMLDRALLTANMYFATAPGKLPRGKLNAPPIDHIALPCDWEAQTKVLNLWEGKVGKPRLSDHSGLVVRGLFN